MTQQPDTAARDVVPWHDCLECNAPLTAGDGVTGGLCFECRLGELRPLVPGAGMLSETADEARERRTREAAEAEERWRGYDGSAEQLELQRAEALHVGRLRLVLGCLAAQALHARGA